jgi:hypothetical protein
VAITSHMPDLPKPPVLGPHFRRSLLLFALLIALILLALPEIARGDIYKWTDDKGRTVLSNAPPPESGKAKNVELLVKEARPATKAPAPIPEHVATPT